LLGERATLRRPCCAAPESAHAATTRATACCVNNARQLALLFSVNLSRALLGRHLAARRRAPCCRAPPRAVERPLPRSILPSRKRGREEERESGRVGEDSVQGRQTRAQRPAAEHPAVAGCFTAAACFCSTLLLQHGCFHSTLLPRGVFLRRMRLWSSLPWSISPRNISLQIISLQIILLWSISLRKILL
jgi:hypothetical protein